MMAMGSAKQGAGISVSAFLTIEKASMLWETECVERSRLPGRRLADHKNQSKDEMLDSLATNKHQSCKAAQHNRAAWLWNGCGLSSN